MTIKGDDNNNELSGTAGKDKIYGYGGNDNLDGLAGNDTIHGGDGNDYIGGGAGKDTLYGDAGNDYIAAFADLLGDGDLYKVEKDVDKVYGGAGDDLIEASYNDVIDGGSGNDSVEVHFTGATKKLDLDLRADAAGVLAKAANMTFTSVEHFSVQGSDFGDTIHLADGTSGMATEGRGGDDKIYGGNGVDFLLGDDGNDQLKGYDGADQLLGGAGDDKLYGGDGDDQLDISYSSGAATGTDTLDGGDGNDVVSFGYSTGGVTADLSASTHSWGGGSYTLSSVEGVWGTNYADTLTGDKHDNLLRGRGGDDVLNGGKGDDTLVAGLGADTLNGGSGNDTASFTDSRVAVHVSLGTSGFQSVGAMTAAQVKFDSIENLTGSAAADLLTGDKNANKLVGLTGDDTLDGGKGDDVLTGGIGHDLLTGGKGADTFVYLDKADSVFTSADLIFGLADEDKIDLSKIDANEGKHGDQAFKIVDAFTGEAGQLVLDYDAGAHQTVVAGDTNGDKTADVLIFLDGDHHAFTNFLF